MTSRLTVMSIVCDSQPQAQVQHRLHDVTTYCDEQRARQPAKGSGTAASSWRVVLKYAASLAA